MIALAWILAGALAGELEPAQPENARSFRLQLVEEFVSTGAEPAFWTTSIDSTLTRNQSVVGSVDFVFELKQFQTIIGAESELRFAVQDGVDSLMIRQNPQTQQIALNGEATIVKFVNALAAGIGGAAPNDEWTGKVRLFDAGLVPGVRRIDASTRFRSELFVQGAATYLLLTYETEPLEFTAAGCDVSVVYRGLGLVDTDKELVYHCLFQQEGSVTKGADVSRVHHTYLGSLLDQASQALVPVEGSLRERLDEFAYLPRPDEVVNPEVLAANPRPEWATTVWLAGRLGCTSLGLVAEMSTNPIPVTSLGSLVLTDQTIGYSGNLYRSYKEIQSGVRSDTDGLVPERHEFRSPLERLYASNAAGPTRFAERLSLIRPEARGAVEIDDRIFGVGMTLGAAALLLEANSAQPLAFAGASKASSASTVLGTASGATAAGILGTGISWTAAGLAAAGVAGGVAVTDDGGSSSSGASQNPTGIAVDLTEFASGTVGAIDCYEGVVRLTATNQTAGATITLRGEGAAADGLGGNALWSENASATVDASGNATLQIPLMRHCDCLDGTISVTIAGQPALFEFRLGGATAGTFNGSLPSTCF